MKYEVKKTVTTDGMDYQVLRDGKEIMVGNWFGESDATLIAEAIEFAKQRGL